MHHKRREYTISSLVVMAIALLLYVYVGGKALVDFIEGHLEEEFLTDAASDRRSIILVVHREVHSVFGRCTAEWTP
jgi:hypothetical protein